MRRIEIALGVLIAVGAGCLAYALGRTQPFVVVGILLITVPLAVRVLLRAQALVRTQEERASRAVDLLASHPTIDTALEMAAFEEEA